jgi:hypothetical protein
LVAKIHVNLVFKKMHIIFENIGTVLAKNKIDCPFTGEISGPSTNGKVDGIYYMQLQPNGKATTRSRGLITVDGGGIVFMDAWGFVRYEANGRFTLSENITHKANKQQLAWLNCTQGVAEGFIDGDTGELDAKVFKVVVKLKDPSIG